MYQRISLIITTLLLAACTLPNLPADAVPTEPSSAVVAATTPTTVPSAVEAESAAPDNITEQTSEQSAVDNSEETTDVEAAATPVLVATSTPIVAEATATPTPTPDWLSTVTVEGEFYVLGNPNAPIRLVDYSDFL